MGYIFLMMFLFACENEMRMFDPTSVDIDQEMERFNALVEENWVWSAKSIEFYKKVEQDKKEGKNIDAKQLSDIHDKGVIEYKIIREKFLEYIGRAIRITSNDVEIDLKYTGPTYYDPKNDSYHVNLADKDGQKLVKIAKMAYASGLILMDNFAIVIANFYNSGQLRRLIDSDNEKLSDYMEEVVENYYNLGNRLSLDEGQKLFKKITVWEKSENGQKVVGKDLDNQFLNKLILNSRIYDLRYGPNAISQGQKIKDFLSDRITMRRRDVRDHLINSKDTIMNGISKVFGNSIGMIEKRKGVMLRYVGGEDHKEINQWTKDLYKEMEPLDILLEKTPFRTTDRFIPGHWGHVAIWSGNKEQLIEMGLWNKDQDGYNYSNQSGMDAIDRSYKNAVDTRNYKGMPFKLAIETGHMIIEALRPGVQINSVHHFMNIDDFAVLRLKDDLNYLVGKEEAFELKKNMLLKAFDQIGKEYDFNFNVETAEKIVCSELAYVTYDDKTYFPWKTTETLNRQTISPDEVAIEAMSTEADNLFKPVLLFHAGVRFPDDRVQLVFDKLLDTENKNRYQEIEFDFGFDRLVDAKEYE